MTFQLSPDLDLGKDTERMTPADKRRQEATVNQLLQAFTSPLSKRREVQLLADEVGLGKTFVALATAYSMLQQLRQPPHQAAEAGFEKCYRAVVVIVPSRDLANKWHQDVEALRLRCSRDEKAPRWFRSRICENAYDLAAGLRQWYLHKS
jgi:superfamily II DNA or RNA helicase